MIKPSLPTLIFDKYSAGSDTSISIGCVRTVTSNTMSPSSFVVTGENLGSSVAAAIAPSTIARDSFFTGRGNPIHPRSPPVLFSVTNTPELNENFFSNSGSNLILLPFERNSVTAFLEILTKTAPSESDNLLSSAMFYSPEYDQLVCIKKTLNFTNHFVFYGSTSSGNNCIGTSHCWIDRTSNRNEKNTDKKIW